ncbi:hypothetical protein Hanom_Chr00s028288g01767721 [Helianthus anomalus]
MVKIRAREMGILCSVDERTMAAIIKAAQKMDPDTDPSLRLSPIRYYWLACG